MGGGEWDIPTLIVHYSAVLLCPKIFLEKNNFFSNKIMDTFLIEDVKMIYQKYLMWCIYYIILNNICYNLNYL